MNWYFRCSIVSLILCKEYKYGNIQHNTLTSDKELNMVIDRTPSYVVIYRSYTLSKMVQFFFWPTLYICVVICSAQLCML